MDERGLSVLSGIAEGINRATSNLVNISLAKQKLNMEKERFDVDKKVKNALLKKYEYDYGPEAIAQKKLEEKQANQLFDINFKIKQGQIGKAEQEARKERELRLMSGIATLEDMGITPEQARDSLSTLYGNQTANVGGQQVGVAAPEFVEAASAFDRGEGPEAVTDPFIRELGNVARGRAGVTKEEATKKLYGLKEEKLTQAQRGIVGDIRSLKNANASVEDINEHIRLQGYEPENFTEEIEGYNPQPVTKQPSMLENIKQGVMQYMTSTQTQKVSQVVDFIMKKFKKTKDEAIEIIKGMQEE
jgi:hypothetical protein